MSFGMMQVMEAPTKRDQTDAIDLLILDHRRIEQLAAQLDTTLDPVETRSIFMQIVEQLSAHEAAEQQVIFPAFRAALEDADLTLAHRMGEHEELNEAGALTLPAASVARTSNVCGPSARPEYAVGPAHGP